MQAFPNRSIFSCRPASITGPASSAASGDSRARTRQELWLPINRPWDSSDLKIALKLATCFIFSLVDECGLRVQPGWPERYGPDSDGAPHNETIRLRRKGAMVTKSELKRRTQTRCGTVLRCDVYPHLILGSRARKAFIAPAL